VKAACVPVVRAELGWSGVSALPVTRSLSAGRAGVWRSRPVGIDIVARAAMSVYVIMGRTLDRRYRPQELDPAEEKPRLSIQHSSGEARHSAISANALDILNPDYALLPI